MLGPGGAAKGNPVYEVMGVTRAWRYSKERMQKLMEAGLVVQTNPGTVPMQKKYLNDSKGVQVGTWWDDISMIRGFSAEKEGYKTQKPEAAFLNGFLKHHHPKAHSSLIFFPAQAQQQRLPKNLAVAGSFLTLANQPVRMIMRKRLIDQKRQTVFLSSNW